jgi:acetylornithine/succinyldiaminopimelate/putrescine aminotransferase
MYDEVQCGIGRTGEFCAWRVVAPDVVPDAISWAKGLAGGFPIGAAWARKPFADLLGPGSHASTFGGTPLACAVALAVIGKIEKDDLMANACSLGTHLMSRLRAVPGVKEVRGFGLMIGVDTAMENKALVNKAAARGLLLVPAGTNTVRFLPPLNITKAEADEAIEKFTLALGDA